MSESAVRTLASGLGFVEGPVLLSNGTLIVVSLDHQCVYAIGDDGATVAARFDAAPNGATEGPDGVVYLACFSGHWPARDDCIGQAGVYAWQPGEDPSVVTTAPLAPNDLCFGPDGLLYVTDPVRGAARGRIWTVDVSTHETIEIAAVDWYPNGIGFDADDVLWVADTVGRRVVQLHGSNAGFELAAGKPDGFAVDGAGHLVVAASGTPEHPAASVQHWDRQGHLIDIVALDENAYYTNTAISADGTLFVTDADQGRVLALQAPCGGGLALHPFRTRG